jgi:undecaprenyl-diphosphatase
VVVGVGWLLTHPLAGSVGRWDDELALWTVDQRTPGLNGLAEVGTFVGNTVTGLACLLVLGCGFGLWRRSRRPVVFVALVAAGLGGIYAVATHVDPRPRPPVRILDPGLVRDHSFPSGHVATATAVVGCVLVLTWCFSRLPLRWLTPLCLLPVLTLFARLYQGAHHLTDVLTGLAYATVWMAVVATLLLRSRSVAARPSGVGLGEVRRPGA